MDEKQSPNNSRGGWSRDTTTIVSGIWENNSATT
jgi:hypothetical protein